MSRFLIDTDTLIDFSKGREPVRARILQMIESGDSLGACAINVAEFFSGVPENNRGVWDALFASLAYWEISRAAAMRAGQDRLAAARDGHSLSTADALIGAAAREYGATILTSNIKDYASCPGVTTSSLRTDDSP